MANILFSSAHELWKDNPCIGLKFEQWADDERWVDPEETSSGYSNDAKATTRADTPSATSESSGGNSRKQLQISRARSKAIKRAQATRPNDLLSPEMVSMQLLETLGDLYVPKSADAGAFQKWVSAGLSSPALTNAAKALSLMLVSRVNGDPRYLLPANIVYTKALRDARQEIVRGASDKSILIGVAHILSVCGIMQKSSLDDDISRPHAQFLIAIMETCRLPDEQTDMMRHLSLWRGYMRLTAAQEILIDRKYPPGAKALPQSTREPSGDSAIALTDLTLWTASFLEKFDRLCEQGRQLSAANIFDALEENVRLERSLHDWMAAYYKDLSHLPYWTTAPQNLTCGQGLGTSALLARVYDFSDIFAAILHVGYWMCLSTLVEARLSIMNSNPNKVDPDDTEYVRLINLSNEYAQNICMSVPALGNPSFGWEGRIMAIRPLHFLSVHYKRRNDFQRVSWSIEMVKDLGIYSADLCKMNGGAQVE